MQKQPTVKSTIKTSPWDTVIPLRIEEPVRNDEPKLPEAVVVVPEPATVRDGTAKPRRTSRPVNADRQDRQDEVEPKTGKRKLTVHLDAELADRVKNAAYWNPRLTIASIAEQGIKHAIEKHERDRGGKYPPREGDLIGGRPIK